MGTKVAEAPRPLKTASSSSLKQAPAKAAPAKTSPLQAEKPAGDQVRLSRGGQEVAPAGTSTLTQGLAANFGAPVPAATKPPTAQAVQPAQTAEAANNPSQKSVDLARQFEGELSQDVAGRLGDFGSAGRKTNNCADFVSSVLEESGRGVERTEDVSELRQQLLDKGWQVIPQDQARPGDVWMTQSDKHGSRHTELVTTLGGTHTIGSNNIAAPEPQQQIFEREARPGLFYGHRPAALN